MDKQIAHNIDGKKRTNDIKLDCDIVFSSMMLSGHVLKGLNKNGFFKPSPVQLKAIPLGICGLDLMIQAKPGTGKTLVFSVIALEMYSSDIFFPQSLILAPTREIAVQIVDVLQSIGYCTKGFKVASFIGGMDINEDRKKIQNCKCVVGTPGRILHLIKNQLFNTSCIKLLILDEADKLMMESFSKDVHAINDALQNKKQTIASSSTYEPSLDKELINIMKNPIGVTPLKEPPILLGVKQYVHELEDQASQTKNMLAKVEELKKIFSTLSFKQCVLFSNSQSRAESYCNLLNKSGWPSEVIFGSQEQMMRLDVIKKLKEFKCRIIVSTDLMARGIDVESVNLVINLDVPHDSATYLHRIGRAGRFGSYGIAITFVTANQELDKLKNVLGKIGGTKMGLLKFPKDKIGDLWNFENIEEEIKCNGQIFGLLDETEINDDDEDNLKDYENVKNSENGIPLAGKIKNQDNCEIAQAAIVNDDADVNNECSSTTSSEENIANMSASKLDTVYDNIACLHLSKLLVDVDSKKPEAKTTVNSDLFLDYDRDNECDTISNSTDDNHEKTQEEESFNTDMDFYLRMINALHINPDESELFGKDVQKISSEIKDVEQIETPVYKTLDEVCCVTEDFETQPALSTSTTDDSDSNVMIENVKNNEIGIEDKINYLGSIGDSNSRKLNENNNFTSNYVGYKRNVRQQEPIVFNNAFENWNEQFWNQTAHIMNYVKYAKYLRSYKP